jgi:F0F1-type ATP synthase assembly protein I
MTEEVNDVPNSQEASYQLGYRQGKADGYELHQYIQKQLTEEVAPSYPLGLVFIGGIVMGAMLQWLFSVVFL